MIDSDTYLYLENKKLKKTDKTNSHFKKMILIEYRNYLIYYLYDRKSNSIFVSCSVNVNKNSMLKKLTITKVYKVKLFTIKFTEFFATEFVKFDEFFTSEFHKIKFLQIDESINKLIFKHMTLSVRNKYKSENKMSNLFS